MLKVNFIKQVRVDIDSYYNSQDCDGWWGNCDFYLKYIRMRDSSGNSLYYERSTGYTSDSARAYFSVRATFSIPSDGRVYLSTSVYDRDVHYDDYIDSISMTIYLDGITPGRWYYRSRSGLSISYKILSCDSDYTGSGCRTRRPSAYILTTLSVL